MEINEKKLSRKTVLIVSLSVFLAIIIVLSAVTILINKRDSNDNQSIITSNDESIISKTEETNNNESIFSLPDASDVFFESIEGEISLEISEEDIEGWVINGYGYTYVYEGVGYEQFNFSTSSLNNYANLLNRLPGLLKNNQTVYNISVPVSATFVDIPNEIRERDNYYNSYQSTFVSTLNSKLNENVVNIPIINEIEEKYNDGEYIFFRSDRNWTQIGAYIAYISYCEKVGLTPYSLENFKMIGSNDYLGCFYLATKSKSMENNPDKLLCYSTVPTINTTLTIYDNGMVYENYKLCDNKISQYDAYDIFLGTTAGRYEINTTSNGGNLLIIGDSSIFPIVPFLASHYNKIDIICPEYFDSTLEAFLKNRYYDSVLTMCYTTNAVNGNYIPSIKNLTEVNENE